MQRSGKHIVIDSGRLRLDVSSDLAFALNSICGRGGREHLAVLPGNQAVWRLTFCDAGTTELVGSDDASLVASSSHDQGAEWRWKAPLGETSADVVVSVRLEPGSSMSYWSLRANLPDGWKVARADFPIVPNIKRRDGLKMAAPFGWGVEYDLDPGEGYEGTYPSLVAAMQFVAFYGGGKGLYVGTHDPAANHKHFRMKAEQDRISFTIINWPAIPDTGGTFELPYEAAIGVFDGDYCDAAQIYRDFTFSAPWGKAGPVSKRPTPQWLKDVDLWLMPEAEPLKNVEACREARDYFGVPTAIHWYNWHEIPFDTLYPEYLPPKPNFAEGVKAFQEAGFHVMPYINGRLCDPRSKTWTDEHADRSAAKQESGEYYTEVYGSKVPLNVMCPYTRQWQEKVSGIVGQLTSEYGVDGVYIDQISAAKAERCFNPDHGHPIGGGRFWVDGYRKLLDLTRKQLPKGRMLTTEENTECWIDQLDALLLVNSPGKRLIPLFPAVYSGRTITFGFQYIGGNDLKDSVPWRAKMARAFAWGSQLGWVNVNLLMNPDVRVEADFLRSLARCRRFAHEYVTRGRFLGMLDARGDNPPFTGEAPVPWGQGTYKIELSSVLTSAWLAEPASPVAASKVAAGLQPALNVPADAPLGILLVNQSNDDHTIRIRLPLHEAGIKPSKGFTITRFGPEGEESSSRDTTILQEIKVPARGALVLKVR